VKQFAVKTKKSSPHKKTEPQKYKNFPCQKVISMQKKKKRKKKTRGRPPTVNWKKSFVEQHPWNKHKLPCCRDQCRSSGRKKGGGGESTKTGA